MIISSIENDLALLRALVARELDTINSYRRLTTECEDPATIEFLEHVVAEEKFHIADALRAIALLDEDQANLLQTGFTAGHVPGHTPAAGAGRANGVGASSIADDGDSNVTEITGNESDREVRRPRSGQNLESTLGSPGRIEPEFGKLTSGTNAGESTGSGRYSGSEKLRVRSAWTVGSLRGVPQHE